MDKVTYQGRIPAAEGIYILNTDEWGRLGIFSKLKPADMEKLLEKVLEHDGKSISEESNQAIKAIAGKDYKDTNPGTPVTYNVWDLIEALNPLIDGPNDEVCYFAHRADGEFTYTK